MSPCYGFYLMHAGCIVESSTDGISDDGVDAMYGVESAPVVLYMMYLSSYYAPSLSATVASKSSSRQWARRVRVNSIWNDTRCKVKSTCSAGSRMCNHWSLPTTARRHSKRLSAGRIGCRVGGFPTLEAAVWMTHIHNNNRVQAACFCRALLRRHAGLEQSSVCTPRYGNCWCRPTQSTSPLSIELSSPAAWYCRHRDVHRSACVNAYNDPLITLLHV